MARRTTAARRYADAAFQMGRQSGDLDAWERDLATLREAFANQELCALMQHPAIPYQAKERVLREVVGSRVGKEPLSLVLLMVRRGRPGAIDVMFEHFEELLRRERGIARAEVRSAMALDDAQRDAIEKRLHELTNRKIELTERVDESLIGGVAVRIGDTLYDASVRSRLERLRARLTAG